MEKCTKCDLHKNATKQVEPRGSSNPLIYFVGEAPGFTEDKEGKPFVGRSGNYLDKVLASFGIVDKVRIFNPIRCIPLTTEGKIRQPSEEEIKICESHLVEDIKQTKPIVIVSLGAIPAQYFLGQEFSRISENRGIMYDIEFHGIPCKFLPTWHPAYLLRKSADVKLSSQFEGDIEKAYTYAMKESFKSGSSFQEKTFTKALDYITFKDFYDTELSNDKKLAFDIETNSLEPYLLGSKIIGFSLANKHKGVYVCFDSLDYQMPEKDIEQCVTFLLTIIKSTKLIVHNSQFERAFIFSQYHYEIPIDGLDDTLMKARLLHGGHTSSALKYQCVTNLGYPDWDKDLNLFRVSVISLANYLYLARNKGYCEIFFGNGLIKLRDAVLDQKFSKPNATDSQNYELKRPIFDLLKVIKKYYSTTEQDWFLNKIVSLVKLVNKEGWDNLPFNYVPERILSAYGAIDALATFDLDTLYNLRMKLESTPEVDLFKGYQIFLEHAFLAYIFEKNGAFWDEEVAGRDEKELTDLAISSLKKMILSPLMKDYIIETSFNNYLPHILISDYANLLSSQGLSIIQEAQKNVSALKLVDTKENKKYHIKYLCDKVKIPLSLQAEINEKVYLSISEAVLLCNEIDMLKKFYNPIGSTQEARTVLHNCLVTSDIIFACFVNNVSIGVSDPDFKIEKVKDYHDRLLVRLSLLISEAVVDSDIHKPDYETAKMLLDKLKKVKSGTNIRAQNIREDYGKALNYTPISTGDSFIIEIFNLYRLTGVDPDDKKTWNENFEWLVNFRMFKKVTKLITTYIEGKVGRDLVKIVNKTDLQEGKELLIRRGSYVKGKDLLDNEAYLLDTSFSVNSAETGRWRSAMHVLPGASKKYFSSRFVGGTILQPDYSQMEVRVLAYVADEKNMLDAFRRGDDIHEYNAQQISGKKEVSKEERKFAKGATFSILYGGTEYSFASEYCGGDKGRARKIFNSFFKTFPSTKKYIERKHLEKEKTGKVSVITNRFIAIREKNEDKAKRQAQNYPIQASASDIVGSVFFDVCQFLLQKGYKSKPFLFTHDSDEIDTYPFELIELIKNMGDMLNELPTTKFGVPCQADITLGKSLGHELVVKEFNPNKSFTTCTMKLKGYKDDFYQTLENWREIYSFVGLYDEKWEEVSISISENFKKKAAFNIYAGKKRYEGSAVVKIKY